MIAAKENVDIFLKVIASENEGISGRILILSLAETWEFVAAAAAAAKRELKGSESTVPLRLQYPQLTK